MCPVRIAQEEYAPEIEADSQWLEKHGFEFHRTRDGQTVLRQLPGPQNALGQVKFIFPNKHNTYMHDTPRRSFSTIRSGPFSHGCMRVENPMVLAERILEYEGRWDDKEILSYYRGSSETRVDLEKPIDVFIDYFTVRVDEAGRTHFLADIYHLVRNEVSPPSAADLRW